VDPKDWQDEASQIGAFFQQFGTRLPRELAEQHEALQMRLKAPISLLKTGDGVPHLAAELNEMIQLENPHVFDMLSLLGRRLFFPKGILAQSAEAKEKAGRFDATIGIAREKGRPMALPSVMKHFLDLTSDDALAYAPATGRADLRRKWRDHLLFSNPGLTGKGFSLPIVTGGVTHALSLVGDLFVDKGNFVLIPDKFWENYQLLFGVRLQAQLAVFPFFDACGGFNVEGLRRTLAGRLSGDKTIVILNFPNNPTGYAIREAEAERLTQVLVEAADNGANLVVVCDDAYFGLVYASDGLQESLFARLADRHERILAVKADGPTKEEYVWGFRTGMLTFSTRCRVDCGALYGALEKKTAGAIRSAVSNCSHLAQSVLVKAMSDGRFPMEQQEKRALLEARAKRVEEILQDPAFADLWVPYPFNSGYFMCLRLKRLDADTYRKHLLERHGVGVIADGKHDIRVAFSAVDLEELPALFEVLARAARELAV
jgi:aspartate/methionine/tyrosine aminotransferase